MTTKRVILLAETNYLLDVVLERHKDCAYLFELAANEEVLLVIPECAFCEAAAKLREIEAQYVKWFDQAKFALKGVRGLALPPAKEIQIQAALDEAVQATRAMVQAGHALLIRTQFVADEIPLTPEILVASHLRRISRLPPLDVKDLELYESILAFARLNRSPDAAMVFLQRDALHFDNPEVKAELAALDVEIYFSAGEAVRRIRELLGKYVVGNCAKV